MNTLKITTLFLLLFLSKISKSQGLILSNKASIIIDNKAYMVLANSGTTPQIDTVNGGGQIISENENNTIRWHLQDTTGDFILPFGTQTIAQGGNGTKIPLSFTINSAGSLGGYIDFSTYETTTDANIPFPTGVTNLFSTPSIDNSLKVIDRFWKIDTNNYSSVPEMTINIGYDNAANEIAGTNTITESNLFAQNWNSDLNKWMTGSGTANTTTKSVNNVSTVTSGFRTFWTLVDNAFPLPIKLLTFNAFLLNQNTVKLDWQTASEINNDYFTILRSKDAKNWEELLNVNGKGNSNNLQNYTINDENPLNNISYYRLKQTDFDGKFTYSKVVSIEIANFNTISIFPNPATSSFTIKGESKELSTFQLFNSIGQEITNTISISHSNEEKIIDISTLKNGVYFVKTATKVSKLIVKK